jgi:hypothetical protein
MGFARAKAVQPDAQGQLHERKAEKVSAGEGAELGVAQTEFGDEVGRNDGIDRAQSKRQGIAEGKAKEDPNGNRAL